MTTQYPLPLPSGTTATTAPAQPPIPGHEPLELRVAEGEDPSVRGDHEVAEPVCGGDHPHDGRVEAVRQAGSGRMETESGNGAVEAGVAEGEHSAVGRDEPISALAGRRRDPDHRALQLRLPVEP